MPDINQDMTIMEVVNKHPQSIKVFFEHGLFCIGCNVAYKETVAQGAAAHGIDIDQLMKRLNQAANGQPPDTAKK